MSKLLALVAGAVFLAAPAFAEGPVKGEWTGWVTDTHCGRNGATQDHTVACVEKCMKGGSKAQLWIDADKKAYNLDDFAKVKGLVGAKVTVKGSLDAATDTITVDTAAKAKSS